MRAREDLHLGQQVAQVLGVPSLAAAGVHVAVRRQCEGRPANHVAHDLTPGGLERRRLRCARAREQPVHLVGREQLSGVGPELVQRRLDPPMTLLRAVAQSKHPLAAVADVIAGFLVGLGRDAGELGVGRPLEAVQEQHAPGVEEELAYDGAAEVAVGELDQVDVAVVDGVAEVGQGVLVAPLALRPGRPAGGSASPGR